MPTVLSPFTSPPSTPSGSHHVYADEGFFCQKLEFHFCFTFSKNLSYPFTLYFALPFIPLLFIKIKRIIFLRNALLTTGSFVSCFTCAETGNQITIYSLVRTHIPPTQTFEWKPAFRFEMFLLKNSKALVVQRRIFFIKFVYFTVICW